MAVSPSPGTGACLEVVGEKLRLKSLQFRGVQSLEEGKREAHLGVSLNPAYRSFLQRQGGLLICVVPLAVTYKLYCERFALVFFIVSLLSIV